MNNQDEAWLGLFHRGDRRAFAHCYEQHFAAVMWAVGQVVQGIDRDTVVQDVFCRLLATAELRRSFTGGNLGAWLITIARRQAIDFRRRRAREQPTDVTALTERPAEEQSRPDRSVELQALIARFEQVLPAKWHGVFRARFVAQLDQREAARRLGMHRTTLAYQEMQIRRLLRRSMLEEME